MRATATSGFTSVVDNTVFVDTVGDYFRFIAGATLTPASNVIVASSDGLGQWQRMGIPNQTFLSSAFWAVDPANSTGRASDENAGWGATQATADLVPLRTFHELNRRFIGWTNDIPLFVHVMSASDSTNFTILTNLRGDGGANNYVTVYGNLIPVDASATRTIATSTAAVPSSNTERTIAITGLGLTPQYVGMIVQNAAGTKTAVVTRQPSSGVLAISEPRSCSVLTGSPGSAVNFSNGEVVTFYGATPLPDWPFPPDLPAYPLLGNVRLDLGTSGVFTAGSVGTARASIVSCILGSDSDSSAVTLVSGRANQPTAPFVTCCAVRKRRVNFAGSWNFLSVGICLNGTGSNVGDGPRLSDATIYINGELSMGGPGHHMVGDGGQVSIVPMPSSQISTFGLTGAAFLLSNDNASHANRGAVIDCTNTVAWYGTNPAIIAGTDPLGLLTIGRGISRLPFTSSLTVTVGGTGKRVAIIASKAIYDFADVPLSTTNGVMLAGAPTTSGIENINLGKHIVGGGTAISYGDQSPASDSTPLTWAVGDRRYAVGGAAGAIAYWRCSVAGTPGTWVAFP